MLNLRYGAAALVMLAACNQGGSADVGNSSDTRIANAATTQASERPFVVTEVADLQSPWAIAFLPDGRMLITEKAGSMLLVSANGEQRREISGVPSVDSAGQGGLMDIALHPQFATNQMIYFSYSESGQGGKGVVLARARLVESDGNARLDQVSALYRGSSYVDGNGHYSGQIAFAPDGQHLFFANGDRQKLEPAQEKDGTLGKILRLTLDGQPAPGNPLASEGFLPEVWSYGHRNILGMQFDAAGNLWQQEMGPAAGDELNIVLPGRNYGWPVVSDGDHYDGRAIPDHSTRPEFEAPKVSWPGTAISPGGLMIYSGKLWPEWRGDIFIGALSGQALVRVDVNGTTAAKGDQWDMGTRIRDVAEAPDGSIWLLEDGQRGANGKLMKLSPTG